MKYEQRPEVCPKCGGDLEEIEDYIDNIHLRCKKCNHLISPTFIRKTIWNDNL